jgi:taurine dioxygenase
MAETAPEIDLGVEQLTGTIGAVVSGIDLAGPLSDEMIERIRALVHRHGVVFFLDQDGLTDESHVRLGARFGELHVHHASPRNLPDHPEIHVVEPAHGGIPWHADATFEERPPALNVLRAVTLPAVGGDTLWTSTCAAYDELSSSLQAFVDGLHAVHESSAHNQAYADLEVLEAVHPVVIDHPWTGRRSIFVNPLWTRRIAELLPRESERVLGLLHQQVQEPAHQVRWRWQPDAVAMWDNFATQHTVMHDYQGPRRTQRVTIRGPRPTSSRVEDTTAEVHAGVATEPRARAAGST